MDKSRGPHDQALAGARAAQLERYRADTVLASTTYLDTAFAGVTSEPQATAAAHYFRAVQARGSTGMADWRRRTDEVIMACREVWGAPRHDVALHASTSEALNLAVHSMRWERGDEVVVADDEFPLVRDHLWDGPMQAGARRVLVDATGHAGRTAALVHAVGAHTRAVAVSHVHPVTGERVDLQALRAACDTHEAVLVVDGVQAAGAIDVAAGAADVYAASCFKWMLGGFGLAVMATSPSFTAQAEPVFRSYRNPSPSRALKFSHTNSPGVFALGAFMDFVGDHLGWSWVHDRVRTLTTRLRDGLAALQVRVITPEEACAGILAFEPRDPEAIAAQLARADVVVSTQGSTVRAAAHFYNTVEDVDRFLDVCSTSEGL